MRVTLLAVALVAASSARALHTARAMVDERLRGAGHELLHYARSRYVGSPQRVSLNGLRFVLTVGTTNDGVREMLAKVEQRCAPRSLRIDTRARGTTPLRARLIAALLEQTTLRHYDEVAGYVACFDASGAALDTPAFEARVRAFSRELDVSVFGTLTYVSAERRRGVTTYVSVRAVGDLPLARAFPKHGDAPGTGAALAPRPPRSTRVLVATTDGAGSTLEVFRIESAGTGEQLASYAATLSRARFSVTLGADARALRATSSRGRVDVFSRTTADGSACLVVASTPRATAEAWNR